MERLLPFRFAPSLNNMQCSEPLPSAHRCLVKSSGQPVPISFPSLEEAALVNPFEVLPLGGTLNINQHIFSAVAMANNYKRPSVAELMTTISGYHVVKVDYVEMILRGDVDAECARRVGPLFGVRRNPYFPIERRTHPHRFFDKDHAAASSTGKNSTLTRRKDFTHDDAHEDAYVFICALQAWLCANNRFMARDDYNESEPGCIIVFENHDLVPDRSDTLRIPSDPNLWLKQPWSFGTYYQTILQALGMKTVPQRSDRLHNCGFIPLTINRYSEVMTSAYSKLGRPSYQKQAAYLTNLDIEFIQRDGKCQLHFPHFYQHAWFSFTRPILVTPTGTDSMSANKAHLCYMAIARSFLANYITGNVKQKEPCPIEVMQQHNLPNPYHVFRIQRPGYNGALFHCFPRSYYLTIHSGTYQDAFFCVRRLDPVMVYHSWPTPLMAPVIVETEEEKKKAEEEKEAEQLLTLLDCPLEVKEAPIAKKDLLLTIPHVKLSECLQKVSTYALERLGASLAPAYMDLVKGEIPMSMILTTLYHLRWKRNVDECRARDPETHANCNWPTTSTDCPLFSHLPSESISLSDQTLQLLERSACTGYPANHTEVDIFLQELSDNLSTEFGFMRLELTKYARAANLKVPDYEPDELCRTSAKPYLSLFNRHIRKTIPKFRTSAVLEQVCKDTGVEVWCTDAEISVTEALGIVCQLMDANQGVSHPKLDNALVILVPPATLTRFPPSLEPSIGGYFNGEGAAYYLYELFVAKVCAAFAVSYAVVWVPPPGPSIASHQTGVFWPEIALPDIPMSVKDKLALSHDNNNPFEVSASSTAPSRRAASPSFSDASDDSYTPPTKGQGLKSKGTKGAKGKASKSKLKGPSDKGVLRGFTHTTDFQLSAESHRKRIEKALDKMLPSITRRNWVDCSLAEVAEVSEGLAHQWHSRKGSGTSLVSEFATMDEKTEIPRVLAAIQLALILKQRCASKKDNHAFGQLTAISIHLPKLQALLRPLYDGMALIADIPDLPPSTTLEEDKVSPMMIDPNRWDVENSRPLVQSLWEILTHAQGQTLTHHDLDTINRSLFLSGCVFDQSQAFVIKAMIVLHQYAAHSRKADAYPFFNPNLRHRLMVNLTRFFFHYTRFSVLPGSNKEQWKISVMRPADPMEHFAHEVAVAVLSNDCPSGSVIQHYQPSGNVIQTGRTLVNVEFADTDVMHPPPPLPLPLFSSAVSSSSSSSSAHDYNIEKALDEWEYTPAPFPMSLDDCV